VYISWIPVSTGMTNMLRVFRHTISQRNDIILYR
jgi:hypothetical protein